MIGGLRRLIRRHIQYPMRDKMNLIKSYARIYRVSGRFIIYPSSVVFIPPEDTKYKPIIETMYKDGDMGKEILRYLSKLRPFSYFS